MVERVRGPGPVLVPQRRMVGAGTRRLDGIMADYFYAFARRFLAYARGRKGVMGARVKAEPSARWVDGFDWDEEERILNGILRPFYSTMGSDVFGVINAQVNATIDWNLSSRGVQRIMRDVATRVTGITETSKNSIRSVVSQNIRDEANTDVMQRTMRDLLRSWGESGGRAHIIALTESANAYNLSAVEGYRETGLVAQVEVYDGDDCGWTEHDDPDMADGSTRTLDEAQAYPTSHPHCQRAFGPVVFREE